MQYSAAPRSTQQTGFTLIEIIIAVGVIALLTAMAYPSYNSYSARGRLAEGMAALSNLRLQTEQRYQDDRTYVASGTCAVAAPANKHFTFTCSNATATTYTWTAKSKADIGLGSANSYTYSVDENGNHKTLAYQGNSININCWQTSKSTSC